MYESCEYILLMAVIEVSRTLSNVLPIPWNIFPLVNHPWRHMLPPPPPWAPRAASRLSIGLCGGCNFYEPGNVTLPVPWAKPSLSERERARAGRRGWEELLANYRRTYIFSQIGCIPFLLNIISDNFNRLWMEIVIISQHTASINV